jgi:hypothetical protein
VVEAAMDIRTTANRNNFTMSDVALPAEKFADNFRQEGEAIERTEEFRADGARRLRRSQWG